MDKIGSQGATFGGIITKYSEELLQVLEDGPMKWKGSRDVQEFTSIWCN